MRERENAAPNFGRLFRLTAPYCKKRPLHYTSFSPRSGPDVARRCAEFWAERQHRVIVRCACLISSRRGVQSERRSLIAIHRDCRARTSVVSSGRGSGHPQYEKFRVLRIEPGWRARVGPASAGPKRRRVARHNTRGIRSGKRPLRARPLRPARENAERRFNTSAECGSRGLGIVGCWKIQHSFQSKRRPNRGVPKKSRHFLG
jgi:hypothetical protein